MNVPIDITGVELKSERLVLRPWQQTDLEDFYEYARVDGVGQMAGWEPHENRDKSQMILDHFISGKKTFAICYGGKVIGSLGVEHTNEEKYPVFRNLRCRELGFVLSKDFWGMGLMPEAVKAVTKWLFETIQLDVITCGYFVWNKQSARVQEKCGFKKYTEGNYETQMGTIENEIMNVLTRENWQAMQA